MTVRKHFGLISVSSEWLGLSYTSPKGSVFSTGTKLFLSNIARILPWGSASSLGSKTSFPAHENEECGQRLHCLGVASAAQVQPRHAASPVTCTNKFVWLPPPPPQLLPGASRLLPSTLSTPCSSSKLKSPKQ